MTEITAMLIYKRLFTKAEERPTQNQEDGKRVTKVFHFIKWRNETPIFNLNF